MKRLCDVRGGAAERQYRQRLDRGEQADAAGGRPSASGEGVVEEPWRRQLPNRRSTGLLKRTVAAAGAQLAEERHVRGAENPADEANDEETEEAESESSDASDDGENDDMAVAAWKQTRVAAGGEATAKWKRRRRSTLLVSSSSNESE